MVHTAQQIRYVFVPPDDELELLENGGSEGEITGDERRTRCLAPNRVCAVHRRRKHGEGPEEDDH